MPNVKIVAPRGFVLIEALIALLIVSLGALAMAKLESLTISAAGESKSRSEAITLAQKKLEQLRNWVIEANFSSGMVDGGPQTVAGTNATYTLSWNIDNTTSPGRALIHLTVSWKDRYATSNADNKLLDLNSVVAWDDPYNQLKGQQGFTGISAPSPSGEAKRGTTTYNGIPQGAVENTTPVNSHLPVTHTYTHDGITELLDNTGKVILYLDSANGSPQSFVTIWGRIYFEYGVSQLPPSNFVDIRLSSEGQCFYNNISADPPPTGKITNPDLVNVTSAPPNSYTFFDYVCYVGPKWWGNVGIVVDTGNQNYPSNSADFNVCVGDPSFNTGSSDGTLISAHSELGSVRSYRGFYDSGSGNNPRYLTTGMMGDTHYPYKLGVGTISGAPRPSDYSTIYPGIGQNNALNYFNQHFLITKLGNNSDRCYNHMLGGQFTRNAGEYYCIAADDDTTHNDYCPPTWPGFVSGTGGQVNYLLSVSKAGGGSGTVSSSPTGISCNSGCTTTQYASYAANTSVQLTATPANSNSTFAGWSSADSGFNCSGLGPCTVTMDQTRAVTATFNPSTPSGYNLTLTVSGLGPVTSDVGGISCSNSTCAANNLASNTVVTLSATPPAPGYGFVWGGACSGSSASCSVTMNPDKSVTATYYSLTNYNLTLIKNVAAGGAVGSSPSGITCGTSCTTSSASFNSGDSVTLSVTSEANGYLFNGWGGACASAGTATSCTVEMISAQSVTANFSPTCPANLSGAAHATGGSFTILNHSAKGSCQMQGSANNYKCLGLQAVENSSVSIRNTVDGNNYDISVQWTCANISQNFP